MPLDVKPLRVGDRLIGPLEPCYVIAEIGLNHNGNLETAEALIDAAILAKADAVKFQKRSLADLYQKNIFDQPRHGEQGLQYLIPLLKEFELSDADFHHLHRYAEREGITFLCTPWDSSSVRFLEGLRLPAYKIGSPDLTNLPLLECVAETGKPLILSTGMSSEDEIRRTLKFLDDRGVEYGLLHCVSTYPAAPEEINLRFMQVLQEWSGRPVGYSGHDAGTAISLAAVARGACMLERHLTLDREMRGPDHSSSLEPEVLATQVTAIREIEAALGTAHRWMTRGEMLNRRVLGKSLVASVDIPKGSCVTREMVVAKSPGMGVSPQSIDTLVGRIMTRDLRRDEGFLEDDLAGTEDQASAKPIDVGGPWGIVARFTDLSTLIARFASAGMSFVEFHISDSDLDVGPGGLEGREYPFGLVVHAPEYCHDDLIDLCSSDAARRRMSRERIQKTVDLTRAIAPSFTGMVGHIPKIVMHVGGMSPEPGAYDVAAANDRLLEELRLLDTQGVDLLLENLPPYPWYFGGKWYGHVITNGASTEYLCRESGYGLCFDTSHAALECNRSGADLNEFAVKVAPFVRHLHVSDAAGTSGEGLQIGEGTINFVDLLPRILASRPTLVPEVWMGHHGEGRGFRRALDHLTDVMWATKALRRVDLRTGVPELEAMAIPMEATILGALQRIDANRMGIGFVVDTVGVVRGVVTDGDVRHGIVRGRNLHTSVSEIMTREFVFAEAGCRDDELRARLAGRSRVIPILDADGRLVDFASDLRIPSGPAATGVRHDGTVS